MKPVEEFDGGARIGAARVRVADVGGEECKIASNNDPTSDLD
jgi:hypothetical protein